MRKAFATLVLATTLSTSLRAQNVAREGMFANPVIRTDVPDPTVIRVGKRYYMAATSNNLRDKASRESNYPIYTSRDLVNWQFEGYVLPQKPTWTINSFWAPELFKIGKRYYCYYTARNKETGKSGIGVAVAKKPGGPYTDHGQLIQWTNEAIDAFVFRDDDGQLYISWKAYGLDSRPIELLAQRLSADGLSLEGEAFTLLRDDEEIGMEGQCIFRHGAYYYILYSARDCCSRASDYEVRVARSTSLDGPYEKYENNPILKGDGHHIQSCGHGTLVTTPDGRYYYLCHCYMVGHYDDGRQAMLQELVIDPSGWPRFKTGNRTRMWQPLPFAAKR
ncbi:MAG: family 43 glycosylhydrolase [Bacteroidaceae bacterium]|nr:family 43 glycosylhydrolase [Bacteroidaceae bacterium]